MTEEIIVHGAEWTIKELFVYPNEFIYWSIQIVMYPYMTGLVAGAFVLSSLYHVFGQKDLKEIAQFSLVFSLALLPVAALPLLLHLQQPLRAMEPLLTPHFTSAIAAFGIVLFRASAGGSRGRTGILECAAQNCLPDDDVRRT
jgi:predicted membrane protein